MRQNQNCSTWYYSVVQVLVSAECTYTNSARQEAAGERAEAEGESGAWRVMQN
jgi:hypothetical protein